MITQYYAVHDVTGKEYHQPFPASTPEQACRLVGMSAKPDTMLARYPDHFVLVHVGAYDSATGRMESSPHQPSTVATLPVILGVRNEDAKA